MKKRVSSVGAIQNANQGQIFANGQSVICPYYLEAKIKEREQRSKAFTLFESRVQEVVQKKAECKVHDYEWKEEVDPFEGMGACLWLAFSIVIALIVGSIYFSLN